MAEEEREMEVDRRRGLRRAGRHGQLEDEGHGFRLSFKSTFSLGRKEREEIRLDLTGEPCQLRCIFSLVRGGRVSR